MLMVTTKSHDPDRGPQEKSLKKSCISFETECSRCAFQTTEMASFPVIYDLSKAFLPPTSTVEVIESERCFCVCVCLCALTRPNCLSYKKTFWAKGMYNEGNTGGTERSGIFIYKVTVLITYWYITCCHANLVTILLTLLARQLLAI